MGNEAGYGGGLISAYSEPVIDNSLFVGNYAYYSGGGVLNHIFADATISNSTFSDNVSFYGAGAVSNNVFSTAEITDSILWDDYSVLGSYYELENGGPYTYFYVSYSDVMIPGSTVPYYGYGNINDDPLFATGSGGAVANDFFLSQTAAGEIADSPCVDAGSDTAANLGLDDKTTRTDGAPDAGVVDMGFHQSEDSGLPIMP